MSIQITAIFCYDFLEDKYFKENKDKQMIYNFVKKIKNKIEEIKSNPKEHITNLFNKKDNKALFYEGLENDISQKSTKCFKDHFSTFISEIDIKIFKSEFVKTTISNDNKTKRLLSYVIAKSFDQSQFQAKNSEKNLKDIYQKNLKDEKYFIVVIYPIEIKDYHK